MTGAPKIEAMKIIDTLEPVKRGIYSGAIGFLDFSGPVDLNIVIRTIVATQEQATFGVGGAVVLDSNPEDEYQETLDKAGVPPEGERLSFTVGVPDLDQSVAAGGGQAPAVRAKGHAPDRSGMAPQHGELGMAQAPQVVPLESPEVGFVRSGGAVAFQELQ